MAEEFLNDSLPDLKELENKVGRKTPESLLIWMKDAAADCEETLRGDVDNSNLNDDISAKITHLKQEMRWLRSTDVRILRQLIAVHEGIEAMRWLVEERGASGSQSSSLTGSLSSLIPVDEPGLSFSRYRDSLSSPHDLTADTEEHLDLQIHTAEVSKNSSERHSSVSSAHTLEVSPYLRRRQESQPNHLDGGDPNPIRSALLRSSRVSRREDKVRMNLSKEDDLKESKLKRSFQMLRIKEQIETKLNIVRTECCWSMTLSGAG
uniref:Leucine rich adaptor protein 1 n=1 Tax=Neogobius melanostomus TaxID=47308 RepID=A0A8C6TN82_9GOBI